MSEYLVDIKNERLSFFTPAGEVKALNDVSIHMREGEVLGIVGESGSGKSVTAYSLMGLTAHPGKLIDGSLYFNGHQIETMSDKEMRKIRGNEVSIIFQDPMTSLNPVYTIGNQIMEAVLLHTDKNRAQAKERARELLELVGINEPEKRLRQYPHELSTSTGQRIVIGRSFAMKPDLLLMDEPYGQMDLKLRYYLEDEVIKLWQATKSTVLFITHNIEEAVYLADRCLILSQKPTTVKEEVVIDMPIPGM